jgi:hypothetical protein
MKCIHKFCGENLFESGHSQYLEKAVSIILRRILRKFDPVVGFGIGGLNTRDGSVN